MIFKAIGPCFAYKTLQLKSPGTFSNINPLPFVAQQGFILMKLALWQYAHK